MNKDLNKVFNNINNTREYLVHMPVPTNKPQPQQPLIRVPKK